MAEKYYNENGELGVLISPGFEAGWCSCYICLPCIENWLEESGQVDVDDELEGE